MMRDDQNPSDAISPATSSPPAVKISREITSAVVLSVGMISLTVALAIGKLEMGLYAVLMSNVLGYLAGRSKPEGVVGEQTLMNLVRR